jgi:hypothetical protein
MCPFGTKKKKLESPYAGVKNSISKEEFVCLADAWGTVSGIVDQIDDVNTFFLKDLPNPFSNETSNEFPSRVRLQLRLVSQSVKSPPPTVGLSKSTALVAFSSKSLLPYNLVCWLGLGGLLHTTIVVSDIFLRSRSILFDM